jgi:aurora kinase
MCKLSGETVCLKAYNMGSLNELNRYQIYREIRLHSFVNHTNVINLYGAFHEQGKVVMVQEMADSGDLFQLFNRTGGKMQEKQAVELVIYPMLIVLNYLHQNGICHRDIKPENILLSKSMAIKLCDFGLAIDLREERAVTRAGTLEYMVRPPPS